MVGVVGGDGMMAIPESAFLSLAFSSDRLLFMSQITSPLGV